MAIIKQCVVCHGDFVYRTNKKTCSLKCRKKMKCKYERDQRASNPEKVREYGRKWYAKNSEKAREYGRKWYAKDSEKICEQHRARRATNPEKARENSRKRYAKNSEKVREHGRKWRAANSEKVREQGFVNSAKRAAALRLIKKYQISEKISDKKRKQRETKCEYVRKWRAANPEKAREYGRKWRADNPEKSHEQSRIYSAKQTAALKIIKQLQQGVMP